MLSWILDSAGMNPGFLIGGQPGNFAESARLGTGDYFVIEADEYDTAFFDKRSKFVHYHPHIAVLNNLEFDHADIFDNLDQIKRQFHHLVRIVPSTGALVTNVDDSNLGQVLEMGLWSRQVEFSLANRKSEFFAEAVNAEASEIIIHALDKGSATLSWHCIGQHNMQNALAAVSTASTAGVSIEQSCNALATFSPSARRLQLLFQSDVVSLYEDFAHHPTAIHTTLEAIRAANPEKFIVAIVEPRSNTMQMGHHGDLLGAALKTADRTLFYVPGKLSWDPLALETGHQIQALQNPDSLVKIAAKMTKKPTVFVAMSNGGFDDIPQKLVAALASK